ncbi:MAG: hypothetical protein EXS67_03280 [Candidatus Margulisbacteria bacterium]|nr:hypothetical protein [Candidatus Margulisiibacteriota bacterium]
MHYSTLIFTIVIRTFTDICFKKAVNNLNAPRLTTNIKALLKNPFFWLGLLFGFSNFISWYITLQYFPLSFAYPFLSITYICIILSGKFLFKEHLDNYKLAGISCITLGALGLFLG